MKKLVSLIAVLVVVLTFSAVTFAEDEGLGIDVTADFYSKYVWRGMLINDDYAFQPGVSTTLGTDVGDFTFGVWGSMDMTDYTGGGQQGEFIEVDYYLDYTVALNDTVSASFGYIYYDFPQTEDEGAGLGNTSEIYMGLSLDTILSPSVTWYMDVDNYNEASYIAGSVGHTFEGAFSLAEDMPVDIELGAGVGYGNSTYNNGYFGVDDGGITDASFSIALPFEVGGLSVVPSFNWTSVVDGDLRDKGGFASEDDQFFTGISLGMSF